ncbi:MAG TPA: ABC transporter ATP-binding protein [Actinomycetota bacterium]|nr:ABC transporter ATP-binding protein [Actinomycetota bacterium]
MTGPQPPPALSARGVVAGYVAGVPIVDGCDLDVGAGELVGIVGPNGAGKSTLLKAIFGLVRVTAGTVALHGDDVTGRAPHALVAAGVGYVPQSRNVFPSLTVRENLEMGAYTHPRDVRRRLDEVADVFPLVARRARDVAGALSGGQRQVVAMARALMAEPSVLLLDEPSAGLSPANVDDVFASVVEVNRAGVAVAMVEQNARRCLETCARAYVLDSGRTAHTGTGRELLDDPKVVQLYLGTLASGRRR